MRVTMIRVLLGVLGAVPAGYGGWLLWPHLPGAWMWLLAGPVLHDALIAPVVGLVGLAVARGAPATPWRKLITFGLAASAVLLLIAVPLVWRPDPAAPNPGLQDRDYVTGLAWWLGLGWAGIVIGGLVATVWRRRTTRPAG